MKSGVEQLKARIVELERRVKELEAQPREQHFHYHSPVYQQPYGVPDAIPVPLQPTSPYKIKIGDPSTVPNPLIPKWGSVTMGSRDNGY